MDGQWTKGYITGHTLTWRTGGTTPINRRSPTQCSIEVESIPPVYTVLFMGTSRRIVLLWMFTISLPFAAKKFDVVLLHAGIEYVLDPIGLVQELHRIIKPGGRLILSFSNRSVEEKSVKVWRELLDFERFGLLLSYLRSHGQFIGFEAYSKRGLPRPTDDRLSQQLTHSDPVFMLWADKPK